MSTIYGGFEPIPFRKSYMFKQTTKNCTIDWTNNEFNERMFHKIS
jgi:hypothetical protein